MRGGDSNKIGKKRLKEGFPPLIKKGGGGGEPPPPPKGKKSLWERARALNFLPVFALDLTLANIVIRFLSWCG